MIHMISLSIWLYPPFSPYIDTAQQQAMNGI